MQKGDVKSTYADIEKLQKWSNYHPKISFNEGIHIFANWFKDYFKSDYYKSGYDRGHLDPAGDMKISSTSMSEQVLLSNISPQKSSFNSGGWNKLESQVRKWVLSEGNMYVVTGPVLSNPIGSIGANRVTIPSYFYKIVYSKSNDKMIGIVMPNQKITNNLIYYVKTVDYIQSITGIDFFHQLEDVYEEKLESEINLNGWNFNK